jgi:hypothetical protein
MKKRRLPNKGWTISEVHSPGMYFSADGWTTNIDQAILFARQLDAQRALRHPSLGFSGIPGRYRIVSVPGATQ